MNLTGTISLTKVGEYGVPKEYEMAHITPFSMVWYILKDVLNKFLLKTEEAVANELSQIHMYEKFFNKHSEDIISLYPKKVV